jgi:hypothetical protein
MKRRTIVVEGPLAFRMRRIAAARRGEIGVQILTLPMLAAPLAGGFIRAAESQDIEPAIRQALGMGGSAELEAIRGLPGMTRSVALTLRKIWQVDLPLDEWTAISARVRDIALLERRVRSMLPAGVLTPRDLRDAAMDRVHHAEAVLGAVDLDRVQDVPPVWRTLLSSLSERSSFAGATQARPTSIGFPEVWPPTGRPKCPRRGSSPVRTRRPKPSNPCGGSAN